MGVHLFAHGLAQQEAVAPVVACFPQASAAQKSAPPEDHLALLPHRAQTLRRRFAALFFAPLVGLAPLTAFATPEPPLQPRLGRGSPRTTLRQVLGQRERLEAAAALRPALGPDQASQLTAVAGPMLADGSRAARPKGKRTRRGRRMAGAHAVIAPHAAGHALWGPDDPPDLHVSPGVVADCQPVAMPPGSVRFGIDRAVQAVAMAWAFDDQGLGVRAMRDANAPQGLESVAALRVRPLEAGTQVSRGPGKVSRPEDPRHGVIVEPTEGTTVVSWGPPKGQDALAAPAWPRLSRERNERPANGCKRMRAQGALATNSGRPMLGGPDRPQHRASANRAQALRAAQPRLAKQVEELKTSQAKVVASAHKGHGQRLTQRQRAWAVVAKESQGAQAPHAQRAAPASALGPPRERADRDLRPQTSMTVRTLRLETALTSFRAVLVGPRTMQVRLDGIWPILFARSGARMVTDTQRISWVNTTGVSAASQRRLTAVVDGLCAMDLREQGKPMHVRLKGLSP